MLKSNTRKSKKWDRALTLERYLSEISQIPVLSKEAEIDLITRAQRGDESARRQIIRSNLRFVVKVAHEYCNRGLPLADIISEGSIGLIRALKTYDPRRGLKFITYAVWWIRQAILHAIMNKRHVVRLPQNRLNDLRRVLRVSESLRRELGREPSGHEINGAMSVRVDDEPLAPPDYLWIAESLESPLAGTLDEKTRLINVIPDTGVLPPDERLEIESLTIDIQVALSILDERERFILRKVYGLAGDRPLTLVEAGERLGLSGERVRQIRNKALKKLRKHKRVMDSLRQYLD
ncbi:RNA polymerase sigma factor RpoD/SigA [bacterium]|nr:RNA polymerase sigma factor RpoD/SigA [bacterium]